MIPRTRLPPGGTGGAAGAATGRRSGGGRIAYIHLDSAYGFSFDFVDFVRIPSSTGVRGMRSAQRLKVLRLVARWMASLAGFGLLAAGLPPPGPAPVAGEAAGAASAGTGAVADAASSASRAGREDLRAELVRRIDELRAAAGAPPLRLLAALDRVAQAQVDEVTRRGGGLEAAASEHEIAERLQREGYRAREWTVSLMTGPPDAAEVVASWRQSGNGTFEKLMAPEFHDLGLGIGRLGGEMLYCLLYAVPEAEAFARETRSLGDLARVRAEILQRVNVERSRAGLARLEGDPRLDRAAQAHAQDMLASSYFAHADPKGRSVRERARAEGYNWRAIGENIAEGQRTSEEVMGAWMRSPEHRRNILDRSFLHLGTGLALGRDPKTGAYRSVWVQEFGAPG
jgi:uncharacterized protein YkwD